MRLPCLDPPFNSNRDYNSIYKDETGRPLPEQVAAFSDTWELNAERMQEARLIPALMRDNGIDHDTAKLWELWMQALAKTQPRLLAYLVYMTPRLLKMYPLMKTTGSLYYHCDPSASHYVKPLLDSIFGHQNFQNEIVWCYREAINARKRWNRKHDTILFYTKSDKSWTFNANEVLQPHSESTIKKYKYEDEKGKYRLMGRGITGSPIKSKRDVSPKWEETHPELVYRQYLRKGTYAVDYWMIDIINQNAKERMGYATQKPLPLLERIIKASSNEGDLVFDPFCGCATTLEAAHRLGRQWIGIDVAIHAVRRVSQVRLQERCGLREGEHFRVDGVPNSVESALELWKQDKHHFQKWVVEEVDGFCTAKKSADGGVDGRIYFYADGYDLIQNMVVEVKGGRNVGVDVLRSLHGVIERDDALLGCLIVQHQPSRRQQQGYEQEIIGAGTVELNGREYPRLQVLSVPEILDGKRPAVPAPVGRHEPQPALLPVV